MTKENRALVAVIAAPNEEGLRMSKRLQMPFVVIVIAVLLALAAATPAPAVERHAFSSSFGSPGAGAGQVSLAPNSAVAVNSSTHDVYVADTGNARIDQFSSAGAFIRAWGWGVADGLPAPESCSLTCQAGLQGTGAGEFQAPVFLAVDNSAGPSAGDVYVGDTGANIVLKFSASGAYIATNDGSSATGGPFGSLQGIATDAAGDLFVYDSNQDWFEFAQDGTAQATVAVERSSIPVGVGLDGAGHLYEVLTSGGLAQFAASGELLGVLSGDQTGEQISGLAVDLTGNDVYADDGGSVVRHYNATCEPVVAPCAAADTFGSGHMSAAAGLAVDESSRTVYAADAGAGRVDVFTPFQLPDVVTGQASGLSTTAATLAGSVNANGTTITDCHFSYVDEAHYEASAPDPYAAGQVAPCAGTPSGSTPVAVSASVTGLTPSTVYHFRLSAGNSNGALTGTDGKLSTGPTLGSTYATEVASDAASLHAEVNPQALATTYHFQYGTSASYGQGTPESLSIGSDEETHLASAHIQGLQPGTTYHYRVVAANATAPGGVPGPDATFTTPASGGEGLPDNRRYELVTPAHKGDGSLPPVTVAGGEVSGGIDTQFRASTSGDGLAFTAATAFPGAQWGSVGDYLASRGVDGWSSQALVPRQESRFSYGTVNITAFSPDLSKFTMLDGGEFHSYDNPPLVPGEPANTRNLFLHDITSGSYQLVSGNLGNAAFEGASADLSHVFLTTGLEYEQKLFRWFAGTISLVSQVPAAPATSCGGGGAPCVPIAAALGAGNDGSNLFALAVPLGAVSSDGSRVFFTEYASGQLYVREDDTRTTLVGRGRFWAATPDGSKVFFSNGDLYEYDVETRQSTDLTPGASVEGVLGVSNDGSYVYYVDTSNRLAVWHEGVRRPVATLEAGDSSDWDQTADDGLGTGPTSRVTPDGLHVAFESRRSLTGFDNRDPVSGQRDEEVYLYDAGAASLACASCDSSGARPTGGASILPTEAANATVARWTGLQYLPRDLSDDGSRLFFETTDALVPADGNGLQDVYEYEGGRAHLISSGTSGVASSFLDASPSGNDVFFETQAQLAPQDLDRSLDIYDARVGGGFPIADAPGCMAAGCQGAPPAAVAFGAPASASFNGAGNVAPSSPARARAPKAKAKAKRCGKGHARKKGKCVKKPRRKAKKARSTARGGK